MHTFCAAEAHKEFRVPDDFPDALKINYKENSEGLKAFESMNANHCKDSTDGAVLFFFENVLARMNPKIHDFGNARAETPLSKIFTVTDEACALTMVLNQCSNWKESSKTKEN